MCLIVLAWRATAAYPLIVAANRDEWRERPAEPARWWQHAPAVLAGRDLQAGGTWMGVTRDGRFAAVTNYRDPSDKRSNARSRGGLVTDFLLGGEPIEKFLVGLLGRASEYNGFNLIVGDGTYLCYYSSRDDVAREIEPGVHGLSNHLLDEPWPKVVRGRKAMKAALASTDPVPPLFTMLSDATGAPDQELPNTGVGIEWERRLAPALIAGEDYGTRASTVLAIGSDGEALFEERTRDASGAVTSSAVERFAVKYR